MTDTSNLIMNALNRVVAPVNLSSETPKEGEEVVTMPSSLKIRKSKTPFMPKEPSPKPSPRASVNNSPPLESINELI